MVQKVVVEIFGEKFSLKTDQDPEYLAQYIEKTSLSAEDVKKESGFNFITGASVSGTAIHKGVYAALAQYAQIGGAN